MDRFSKYCKVISGYAFKAKDLMEEGDIPVVKIGNISNGGNVNISSNTQYVDRSFLSLDEKYHIKNKDILISLTGSHMNQPNSMVGRSCRSYNKDTYLLNQRAGKVIPFDNADKDYLYYLLSSEEMKYSIVIRAYGAANQVNISPSDIEGIKWNFPEYDVQCKIGKILSTYDDLIEKNNRKIEILQEMAEELYKEWFVRRRNPDWKIVKFNQFGYDIESGNRPKGGIDASLKEGVPSLGAESIGKLGIFDFSNVKLIPNEFYQKMKRGIGKDGDILLYKDGAYIGKVTLFMDKFPYEKYAVNEHVFLIRAKDKLYQYYLYFTLNQQQYFTQMQNLNRNAAQPGLTQKDLDIIKLCKPDEAIIKKFNNIIEPMLHSVFMLAKQNENLKTQRDLLLPRLMSGKLEVS